MVDSTPRITVIIAVRNGAATLQRAIDSVFAQTYESVELIVIDGASTDGTPAIIEQNKERIAYWESKPDRGIYHAWNKALDHASGDWICFLGADDQLADHDVLAAISLSLACAPAHCEVVYGAVDVVDASGGTLLRAGEPWRLAQREFFERMTIPHQGTFHRRELFRRVGKFDETFQICGDYELLLRTVPGRAPQFVPGLVIAKMGAEGISSRPGSGATMSREFERALRRHGFLIVSRWTVARRIRHNVRLLLDRVGGSEATEKVATIYRRLSSPAAAAQQRVVAIVLDFRRRLDARVGGFWSRRVLVRVRAGRDVCWTESDAHDPLVTIRIATKDRPDLLIERALRTALSQTYRNLEILVVGDDASAATKRALAEVKDPRLRFVNLPPTRYPNDAERRWLVQGHAPWNHGLDIARGAWITSLDDDDEYPADHVEVLLDEAVQRRLEFVYGNTAVYRPDGRWGLLGEWPPRFGRISHGAFLYSTRLRFIRYDELSWRFGEATDWNLVRRMRECGVRMGYIDRVVYRYFPARHVPDTRPLDDGVDPLAPEAG